MSQQISYETANRIARVWDDSESLEDAMRRAGLKTKDRRNMNKYRRQAEEILSIKLIAHNLKNSTTLPPTSTYLDYTTQKTGVIFSDAHYSDRPSPAHKILCKIIKDLKPDIVINNGDSLDFPAISRHDPDGFEEKPLPADELEINKQRLQEIADCSDAELFWNLGNHDQRLQKMLVKDAPALEGWPMISIADNFPDWKVQNSIIINRHFMIKHKTNNGGQTPERIFALNSGLSIAIGHHHRLRVIPLTDFRGTRYGICTGMLGEPFSPAFDYCDENFRDWQPGFVVFTIDGENLYPETVSVKDGKALFRGKVYTCD